MDPVYVTGHKNPDTDSIVSAMAYAALRNALGDRAYVAARLGGVSDETQMVLDRFGFEPPQLLRTVRTQVRDLLYDTPPMLGESVTVSHAWTVMTDDTKIISLPVTNEKGELFGMLTRGDIADYDMGSIVHPFVERIPLFNLLGALEGRILGGDFGATDEVSGEVVIAMPQIEGQPPTLPQGAIVLCGAQESVIHAALDAHASLIILCRAELEAEFRSDDTPCLIVATPYDPYRAARMIFQSIPVSRICHRDDLVSFHLDDFLDDVREGMLESRFRSYPILDEYNRVVGAISRYHLIKPKRKRVVLVDHNERAQSVPGLEQAEILQIIDHHRLADVETGYPVYFRNEPVGSTTTIVASMYQEMGLVPGKNLAGLIAAAILSDTVMFKSPTCTPKDVQMAERMARIAQISLETLGHDIFAASSSEERPASDMLFSDFKAFHLAGHDIGIGQITCMDAARVLKRRDELLQLMQKTAEARKYDMLLLMITDVLREGTELLFIGDDKILAQAFSVQPVDHHAFLPGIVSRKKQVVPALSVLWG